MKMNNLNVASNHVELTNLAIQLHVLGLTDKAEELANLEAELTEFQIRWAYCCAGISSQRIDELVAHKFEEVLA